MSNKLTHPNLVSLGKILGFGISSGLCCGFSSMLTQAWLDDNEDAFFERLQFIETYDKDFQRLKEDIKKAGEPSKSISANVKLLLNTKKRNLSQSPGNTA